MIFLIVMLALLIVLSFVLPAYVMQGAVRMATPLLLAGIGGLFCQLSGVLNIALEGLMVFSAFFSVIGALYSGSILVGTLTGVGASVLLAFVFASVSLGLKANIFFTGLATNLFAPGFTVLLQTLLFHQKGAISLPGMGQLKGIPIPAIRSIPFVGEVLSGHTVFVYLSWLAAIAAYFVIYETTFGLRIRSVGENPDAFRSIGLSPNRYQLAAILISGLACGLAGAGLCFSTLTFAADMINNRGWIGLVTIFLGGQHPAGIVAAALLFGGTEQISYILQISSGRIPPQFLRILPYVATILAMTIHAQFKKSRSRIVRRHV